MSVSHAELLSRLVAFDTTSYLSNLPIIDFIEGYLAGHGIESELVKSPDGKKANLFATIGPRDVAGIALSGHTDVVPVEGQNWTTDPFQLAQKHGRLFGRGTCDMKGFVACVLEAVPNFVARDLAIPIHLAFSYDEEVGCLGARQLVGELGTRLECPRIVIVGEPTGMTVADAHKGIHLFATEITGREAHNSMPRLGVNAIEIAAKLIGELDRIGADLAQRQDGERFDPPHTTVTVAKVVGGTALNIIPNRCEIFWQFRNVPATDPEEVPRRLMEFAERELLPVMRATEPNAGIETRKINTVPGFQARAQSEAVSLAMKLAEQNEVHAVPYGTEAGLFEQTSAAVVCGPGGVGEAHRPDEFIEEAQLAECSQFLERLADHATTG
jgi:acetylornithine deacetylase